MGLSREGSASTHVVRQLLKKRLRLWFRERTHREQYGEQKLVDVDQVGRGRGRNG